MKSVAPLRYDVIFKKAFSDPVIFTAFAKDVLQIELEITKVETEKRFEIPVGPIESRFDLYGEDPKNRVVVAIQQKRLPDHYDKFLYYQCVALLEQAARSTTYRPNLSVFTIVVLTSGDRHKRDVSIIDFDPKDLEGRPLGEIKHKVFYLCPKYLNPKTPPLIREWLEAVEDTFDEEVDETRYRATIQEVFKRIEKDKTTRQERAQMKEEAAQQLKEVEEYERGLLIGRTEGKAEGKAEGYTEIVARMAQKGMAAAEIATLTDLPLETVEQLLNGSALTEQE